jgi:hypothetical protein
MQSSIWRLFWGIGILIGALGVGVGVGHAQQIWRGGYGGFTPPKFATPKTFTGGFNFCRVMFTSDRREKRGWDTDYPGAEINFSVRLSELTKTKVSIDSQAGEGGDPDYVVVRLTDEALFQCPFVMMEDAGGARLSEIEATRLREYLLKGGFLLVADYWGSLAKQQWDEEIGRVLSPAQYPIVDIPMNHPIWRTFFELKAIPQMASIQFWRRSGGGISERGSDSARVDVRGIADTHGRLMVLMLHNTDIPDGWEREGEDPEYFYRFSPDAYAVGIDLMLYAMTH